VRTPRYKLVLDRLAAEIRAGRWPAGTRLPTHRRLAEVEGVAVVTASRVYAELEAMGLVSSEQGRGTFVRDRALSPGHGIDQQWAASDVTDLNFNYPALPGQAEILRSALRELAGSGDLEALLRYQPHRGRPHDRAVVAGHLRRRGLDVDADRVAIVSGAQHGLAVACTGLLRAGDVVAVDALTYPGFKALAGLLGLELAPIRSTATGPDLNHLEQVCAHRGVQAVYCMPTLHNPLGWVLDADVRERLVQIARRHQLMILEDASYAYLADDAPTPLAALAPERTVHVTGLSKSVATGLRVGFLTAPPDALPSIERAIRATTWNTPSLTTAIACRWIDDGTVDRLEADKRRDATARQAIAREALAGLPYVSHPSSYFLWLPLAEDARADRLAAALAQERISVATAVPFATTTNVPQALRLALGSVELAHLPAVLDRVRAAADDDAFR